MFQQRGKGLAPVNGCLGRLRALAAAALLTALFMPLPAQAANSGGTLTGAGYVGIPKTGPASGATVTIDSDVNTYVYGGYSQDASPAADNSVSITGGTVLGQVSGGYSDMGDATNNTVNVSGGTVRGLVYGGVAMTGRNAVGNAVTISGGTIQDTVYGGVAAQTAEKNVVTISGGTMEMNVGGGFASGNGDARDNNVSISGGTIKGDVLGGMSASGLNSGNVVDISGGTIQGDVYGGLSFSNGSATDNVVRLSGNPNLTSSTLYGGFASGNSSSDIVSGNRLEVHSSGLTAVNIKNFEQYDFQLPDGIQSGTVLLTLTDKNGTNLTVSSSKQSISPSITISVDGSTVLQGGDYFVLLENQNGLITGQLPDSVSGSRGVTLTYDFTLSNENGTSLVATVQGGDDGKLNPRTKALAEGRLAGTALTLQGADLVAGKGTESAVRAVRASLADSGRGLAAFGALSGGWSRYNTGSHIDVSGFSLLTGLAWGAETVLGHFTTGMFFEYGNAASGTYNSFGNAASVSGDGSLWYMGAGLLARMDFVDLGSGHVYAEASARGGALHNSYHSDDLRDGFGRRAEFNSSSPYVSLHGGLGYIWNLTDALSLDVHAKYFWTYQDSSDTNLSTGERLHFGAVNSHRVRLGGRLAYAVDENIQPYIGAAWEHEFDGKARATSIGYSLDAPSLTGDTGIGELGLSWTPSANTPLSVDLSVQGYTGVREGYTGSVMARWEF